MGVSAEYYDNLELAGAPAVKRVDDALSFHWFRWGPDPKLLPNASFSVRWMGTRNPNP